jgi:predicted CoA-binding protein
MLDSLLYPKAVAVMGASRTPGKVGYAVVANLILGGFEEEISSPSTHQGAKYSATSSSRVWKSTARP